MCGTAQTSTISASYLLAVLRLITKYSMSSYMPLFVDKPRQRSNVQLDIVFKVTFDSTMFLHKRKRL